MMQLAAHIAAYAGRIYTLTELKDMYRRKLEEADQNNNVESHIYPTRFRECLMQLKPDLRESCAGKGHPTLINHKLAEAQAVDNKQRLQADDSDPSLTYIKAALSLHELIADHKVKYLRDPSLLTVKQLTLLCQPSSSGASF